MVMMIIVIEKMDMMMMIVIEKMEMMNMRWSKWMLEC